MGLDIYINIDRIQVHVQRGASLGLHDKFFFHIFAVFLKKYNL